MESQGIEQGSDQYRWVAQLCPICDIKPSIFIGRRGGFSHRSHIGVEAQIWSCGECGLIFPDPMPVPIGGLRQHYNVDADDYFAKHETDERLLNAQKLIADAEIMLGRKGKLLDVGVGRGEILLAAREAGWEVFGIEPSDTFASYAEKFAGATVLRKPIEECDLPEAEFDVVILAAVLEHLYQPDQMIAKLSRALVGGGLMFVDVPNEKGLFFTVGNAYERLRGRDWCLNLAPTFSPFHIFGFGPTSLRKLLSKYGLTPVIWTVYGGTSFVTRRSGPLGLAESLAARVVSKISNLGEMGTYIETWAVKE